MSACARFRKAVMVLTLAVAGALVLGGCGLGIPRDPHGTLERVTDGVLRVGVSPNGSLVTVDGGAVGGSEPELIEGFADSIGARVEWTVGSEEALVRGLEAGRLDLVAGGITSKTPWTTKAGKTRPYTEVPADGGGTHRLVFLVPLGENGFLAELERYLDREAETP